METKTYYLTLDLQNDVHLIEMYKKYHEPGNVWPEIIAGIKETGVKDMEIYLVGNRLFMSLTTDNDFNWEKKVLMDANNPKIQEWEQLMWRFQKPLAFATGEKWVLMERVFKLSEH